jgi:hypothetical protein
MLSRFGEESHRTQIRSAFNTATTWSPAIALAEAKYDTHAFSKLFTGGAFDVFVEIYERYLVRHGAIPAGLARESKGATSIAIGGASPSSIHRRFQGLRQRFADHFADNEQKFRLALLDARDDFGHLLAKTWARTTVEDFPGRDRLRGNDRVPYAGVVTNMIAADRALGGRYAAIIRAAFRRRGISPARRRR